MADRPGDYSPGWGDLPGTPGANWNDPASWRLPWRSGEAIWCAFDHGSIAGAKFGGMGFVDYFRLPKRQWYWYRNEYKKIPPPEWPAEGKPSGLKLTADKTRLRAADGTDDAQIIVTVVDAKGKGISNSPPVTLTVESGPGEFPTGPSITFAPDSDIAIRDGMAAIEFRSYYAGRTVIRATSPGLKDATLEIATQGGPAFVAGKTPPVKPRPYVRFQEAPANGAPVVLGKENPTSASSEAAGHSGRAANDRDPATFWQAANGNTNAWLVVDLERLATIRGTKLLFPSEGAWRYKIEVSDSRDGGWKLFADRTQSADTSKERADEAHGNAVGGRFLRITITRTPSGQPPALAEVEATGTLNP
jgi:hypothetical protein